MNKQLGKKPGSTEWKVDRRNRFIKMIREGKRTLKLTFAERQMIIALANYMRANNDHLDEFDD